jgi:hypothetical protein
MAEAEQLDFEDHFAWDVGEPLEQVLEDVRLDWDVGVNSHVW